MKSSSVGSSELASSAKPAVTNLKCSCASASLSCFSGGSPATRLQSTLFKFVLQEATTLTQ